jgi:hypothetical protein
MNAYYKIRIYLILFSYWSLRKQYLELDSLDSVKRNFLKIRCDETFYHKLWLISRRVINTSSRWKIRRYPKKSDMDFKSIDKKNHLSYSLSGQDLFVIYCIDSSNKPNSYLEIGAGHPSRINNTFLLETFHNWSGISIDYDQVISEKFNEFRKNPCLNLDATKIDYEKLLKFYKMSEVIDYLSLDIDPAHQTLKVLLNLPLETFHFRIITFEHDSYQNGMLIKLISRWFLETHGYTCIHKNVKAKGFGKYEDWWIHPDHISKNKALEAMTKLRKILD